MLSIIAELFKSFWSMLVPHLSILAQRLLELVSAAATGLIRHAQSSLVPLAKIAA